MKYVKGFDTIRALAVFFVIFSHWGPVFDEHSIAGKVLQLIPSGLFGVTMFFVLSGFLITSILLNERAKIAAEGRAAIIKNFFARRILRIFPIYYLTIFVLLILNYPYLRDHAAYFLLYMSNILLYKTNTPNPLIHTWSLAVEEQFYLIWPWLILFLKEKYLKYMFAVAIITGIVSKYIVTYTMPPHIAVLVFNYFDAFGIGGLYAYVRLNGQNSAKFERAFIVLFSLLLFIGWRLSPVMGAPLCVIYSLTLDSIISLAIIMFVLKNKSAWIQKYLLENRFFNFVGKISYGLYLYHYVLGNYYDDFLERLAKARPGLPAAVTYSNSFFSLGVKLTLLFIISWASFRIIEQPILQIKKRFHGRTNGNNPA